MVLSPTSHSSQALSTTGDFAWINNFMNSYKLLVISPASLAFWTCWTQKPSNFRIKVMSSSGTRADCVHFIFNSSPRTKAIAAGRLLCLFVKPSDVERLLLFSFCLTEWTAWSWPPQHHYQVRTDGWKLPREKCPVSEDRQKNVNLHSWTKGLGWVVQWPQIPLIPISCPSAMGLWGCSHPEGESASPPFCITLQ